jgi:hypothetical protein
MRRTDQADVVSGFSRRHLQHDALAEFRLDDSQFLSDPHIELKLGFGQSGGHAA